MSEPWDWPPGDEPAAADPPHPDEPDWTPALGDDPHPPYDPEHGFTPDLDATDPVGPDGSDPRHGHHPDPAAGGHWPDLGYGDELADDPGWPEPADDPPAAAPAGGGPAGAPDADGWTAVFGADPDLPTLDEPHWTPVPAPLDFAAPEPVDGFPWADAADLGPADSGAAHPTGPLVTPSPDDLAGYAALDLPPGADPWAALTGSDDPATSALARFWHGGTPPR